MNREKRLSAFIDLADVRSRERRLRSDFNAHAIDLAFLDVAQDLLDAVAPSPGQRLLDFACGSGNLTLLALDQGIDTISTDVTSTILNRARERVDIEGWSGDFRLAEIDALPFEDDAFDRVASTFGLMTTSDPIRTAAELTRVCRPGGKIGLANWSADGLVGELYALVGRYQPPPLGLPSPMPWGTEGRIKALFEDRATRLTIRRKYFFFRDQRTTAWLTKFKRRCGPVREALESLSPRLARALENDLRELHERRNRGTDGKVNLPASYLEIVISNR